ncbi:MAG: hypothetical protein ABJC63_15470, partial [Gemmatimonadales bacterium]
FDKLKEELDKAGRAAQGALDEGKIRIEAFRTRQLADKAAQALGYAVFRARQGGGDVDSDTYTRLSATLATHDTEAAKFESELDDLKKQNRTWGATSSAPDASPSAAADAPPSATYSDPAAAPDVGTPPNAQDISG